MEQIKIKPRWFLSGLTLAIFGFAGPVFAADQPAQATLSIHTRERSPLPISPYITGKFAEHLGNNIYNGMDAQILRNPTFADYPFWSGQMTPDGVTTFHFERDKVDQEIRRLSRRGGCPDKEVAALVEAYHDGLACLWTRLGTREAVQVSPDTAPYGQRAQRLEVKASGLGIAQWVYLPLHRTNKYEFELFLRSPNLREFTVSLDSGDPPAPGAATLVKGVTGEWKKFTGVLEAKAGLPEDDACRFSLIANAPGQFVIGRAQLRPADHLEGADPDIVRLLKESRLPILRWPGGNFVSGYHWEDGVGPVEKRPAKPNFAWGGVEPNLFGTDEFIAFCRAVGCEPMICVNAGNGTPAEAARWIEYCTGSSETPLGKLRAANGHAEPYAIRYWEIGNELWGRWQYNWTTATGYVDRYHQFAQAMLAADAKIKLLACGAPVLWGKQWNDTLLSGAGAALQMTTDHPLIGGNVPSSVDPLDVFRDFMAVPAVLEQKWAALQQDMLKAGIKNPRLAVTELQMFAHLGGTAEAGAPARLSPSNLVNPGTMGEALYDVLIYHGAIRLAPFVEMVTHSAIVNHGGGLRKERERVYANPCHYAQAAFADFAGAVPVRIDLEAPVNRAPWVLPDLRNVTQEQSGKTVDALAALATNGDLLVSIVHRSGQGSTRLQVQLNDFDAGKSAEVRTLSAEAPWAVNTLNNPETVKPRDMSVEVNDRQLTLELRPYSVLRVRIPKAKMKRPIPQ